MLIANPIYDIVFKRLMENERVAKFFIGTFLGNTVEELHVRPQEFTYAQSHAELPIPLRVFRLDFLAVVRMDDGSTQKILIEIQKGGKEADLMRFRNYLGEQYKKKDALDGGEEALPIKTIYILGFQLPGIESPCLHVERQYRDMLTGEAVSERSPFIERLTHDSYVVQVGRVGGRQQTRLERLLTIFEQAHFIDSKRILKDYPYEPGEEELREMVSILHRTGTDAATREAIEVEEEAWRSVNAMIGQREKELMRDLEQERKEKEAKERELELERQAKELERQAKEAKERELEQAMREIEELKRKMRGE